MRAIRSACPFAQLPSPPTRAAGGRAMLVRPRLNREHPTPGVLARERLIKVEDVGKFFPRIRGLTHEQPQIDQREHDVAQICAGADPPMLQYEPSHDAELVQREVPARQRKLPPTDVPPLLEPLLAKLESAQHEQIRTFIEPRLAQPNAVHDPVAKREFRHQSP